MKKTDEGFLDFSDIDPAVDALIGDGKRRKGLRHLGRKERSKKEREQEKQSKRQRVQYDIPFSMRDELAALAKEYDTTASQIVQLAVLKLMDEIESGEIQLENYRVVIKSPVYGFRLEWKKTVAED